MTKNTRLICTTDYVCIICIFGIDNPQIQKPLMKNRTILALHTDRGHQYHTLQTYTALVKCSYQVRTEECLGGIGVESSTHQ